MAARASLLLAAVGFQVALLGQLLVKSEPDDVILAPPAMSAFTVAVCCWVSAAMRGVWPNLHPLGESAEGGARSCAVVHDEVRPAQQTEGW